MLLSYDSDDSQRQIQGCTGSTKVIPAQLRFTHAYSQLRVQVLSYNIVERRLDGVLMVMSGAITLL